MIGLPSGEETMTIRYAVSIEYRNTTDGRTDRIAISILHVSIAVIACANNFIEEMYIST